MSGPSPALPIDPHALTAHYLRPGTLQLREQPPLALYIHLPWCLRKCPYCDFNSHAVRGEGLPADAERAYLAALSADLQASLPLIWGRPIVSVFIGGGTPSLFSPDAIAQLLSDVRALLPLQPQAEITLEANPGTFERERFDGFAQAGVTRLSIGVQSFSDAHLKAIGRVHDRAQAIAAAEHAAQHFERFNLDLMYALPGQTLAQWREDLSTALALRPPHLSLYHLTLEPNTAFASAPPRGLPDDDAAALMMDAAVEAAQQAGLERYEVSAYARAGQRCAHNLNYWQFGDYLGLGAGAHSKLSFPHRVVRQVRWREPAAYQREALAGKAISNQHEVARGDVPFEFMMNALRLKDGFEEALFTQRTGLPWSAVAAQVDEAIDQGFLARTNARGALAAVLQPTPRGFDFLSDLQALFLA